MKLPLKMTALEQMTVCPPCQSPSPLSVDVVGLDKEGGRVVGVGRIFLFPSPISSAKPALWPTSCGRLRLRAVHQSVCSRPRPDQAKAGSCYAGLQPLPFAQTEMRRGQALSVLPGEQLRLPVQGRSGAQVSLPVRILVPSGRFD